MRSLLIVSAFLFIGAACNASPKQQDIMKYEQVISSCVGTYGNITGLLLPAAVDRAYVHEADGFYYVLFTHGAIGTFRMSSPDYRLVFECAIRDKNNLDVVFIGEPMEAPLLDNTGGVSFGSPEGNIEVLFERVGEDFKYCCSQIFKEENLFKHNPDLLKGSPTVS